MRIRSAGLAALVAAAGIWMSFSGEPAMAAKSAAKAAKASKAISANRPVALAKFKKQHVAAKKSRAAASKSAKSKSVKSKSARYAKRTGSKVSSKVIEAPETWEEKPSRNEARAANKTELPASVANARAQALADDEARNYSALDSTDIVDNMKLASADQVNTTLGTPDNTVTVAQDATPPAASPPPTSAPGKILRPMPSADKPVVKAADDSDPLSKTSLIGKIFIAFGSLLTLASAARLFIA